MKFSMNWLKQNWLKVSLVVIIVGGTGWLVANNKLFIKPTEIVELCEIEQPSFNAKKECQEVLDRKYFGRNCSFVLGKRIDKSQGSCTDCIIKCGWFD